MIRARRERASACGPTTPPGVPSSIARVLRGYAERLACGARGYDADDLLSVGLEGAAAQLAKEPEHLGLACTVARRRMVDRHREVRGTPRRENGVTARAKRVNGAYSLDAVVQTLAGEEITLSQVLGASDAGLALVDDRDFATAIMARAFAGLRGRNRRRYPLVVTLRLFEDLTLCEIGSVIGVAESRACQIYGEALALLRTAANAEARRAAA